MKKVIALSGLLFSLCAALAINSVYAEPLGKEALKDMLSGNTAEGVNLRWNKNMKWYFEKEGKLKKLDHLGNKSKGSWNINDHGQLCAVFKNKEDFCMDVTALPGGGYELKRNNELKWRFDKIVKGNPHDL